MFIDHARIIVASGDGGNGCVSFRREKFVPRGGPDGGDGGDGGSVHIDATPGVGTLVAFRYKREFRAERGRHGMGARKTGRSGEDLIVRVPLGTIVHDADSGGPLADLINPDQRFTAAKGGRGGRGNARFATSTNQAPRRADDGSPGEERALILELKLLADVGLVGFPNAGKSTLISRISDAHPRIADYPFTTLTPHLGHVVVDSDFSYIVADIPGLIEGASRGAGLGTQFLRHIERTSVLLHLVDVSPLASPDPITRFEIVERELEQAPGGLASRPRIVVATKCDTLPPGEDHRGLVGLREHCEGKGFEFTRISAVTGEGVDRVVGRAGELLRRHRADAPVASGGHAAGGGKQDPDPA